jgi:hypothetical protein
MDYFAGLDISMDETHVCVLDREGVAPFPLPAKMRAFRLFMGRGTIPESGQYPEHPRWPKQVHSRTASSAPSIA